MAAPHPLPQTYSLYTCENVSNCEGFVSPFGQDQLKIVLPQSCDTRFYLFGIIRYCPVTQGLSCVLPWNNFVVPVMILSTSKIEVRHSFFSRVAITLFTFALLR